VPVSWLYLVCPCGWMARFLCERMVSPGSIRVWASCFGFGVQQGDDPTTYPQQQQQHVESRQPGPPLPAG
jgi:hypothetical protein